MHWITRYRPTPALVVASIALLVALAGTGFAAVSLAPANSVGTAAVINNSLLRADFKADQLPAASAAFSRSLAGPGTLPEAGAVMATMDIPTRGKYLVWAKIDIRSPVEDAALCKLVAGSSTDTNRSLIPAVGDALVSSLLVGELAAGDKAELQCSSVSGKANARDVKLVALKVASLNGS